jgi:glycogen synthase
VSARERLLRLDATWVFVGTGEARFERALTEMAAEHPARVASTD